MSQIPSDLAASSLQSQPQAQQVSRARGSRPGEDAAGRISQKRAIDEAGEAVHVEGRDTAVFADSQGLGSQGRSDSGEQPPLAEGDADGVDLSANAEGGRLDIEA